MESSSSRSTKKQSREHSSGSEGNATTTGTTTRVTSKMTTPTPNVTKSKPPTNSTAKGRVAISGSTGTSSRVDVPIKLKKNLFPAKVQGGMKIKKISEGGSGNPAPLSLPTIMSSANSTKVSDTTILNKPIKATSEGSNSNQAQAEDRDEEVLDSLYTRYLQQRLLAQIAAKKRRLGHTANMDKLTTVHISHVMDKKCYEAQYNSLLKIEKQVENTDKIKSLAQDFDRVVEKLSDDKVLSSLAQFEQNLGDRLDVLSYPNLELETIDCETLLEPSENIESALSSDEHPVGIIASTISSRKDLQQIHDSSASNEREVNEQIVKLVSLKISKSYLS